VAFQSYLGTSSGTVVTTLKKNGTVVPGVYRRLTATGADGGQASIVGTVVLAAGDYVEVFVNTSVAGNLAGHATNAQGTQITVKRIGASV
jgi:hypothetical protein